MNTIVPSPDCSHKPWCRSHYNPNWGGQVFQVLLIEASDYNLDVYFCRLVTTQKLSSFQHITGNCCFYITHIRKQPLQPEQQSVEDELKVCGNSVVWGTTQKFYILLPFSYYSEQQLDDLISLHPSNKHMLCLSFTRLQKKWMHVLDLCIQAVEMILLLPTGGVRVNTK